MAKATRNAKRSSLPKTEHKRLVTRVVPHEETGAFSDLEPLVCDAAGLSTALAMAIEGIDRLAMEDADQRRGLQALASEAMYAAQKARTLWYELQEQQKQERAR